MYIFCTVLFEHLNRPLGLLFASGLFQILKIFIINIEDRADRLLLLYNECLNQEPTYIPRKFRNDTVYTMNESEKQIYFKLYLNKN